MLFSYVFVALTLPSLYRLVKNLAFYSSPFSFPTVRDRSQRSSSFLTSITISNKQLKKTNINSVVDVGSGHVNWKRSYTIENGKKRKAKFCNGMVMGR